MRLRRPVVADKKSIEARHRQLNIDSSLTKELRDKEYRDAYVGSQIRIGLPFQIRAVRKERGWSQADLAEKCGMAAPRISEIEKPGERRLNIETLLRVAAGLDVGLEVRFVPFSQLVDHSEGFNPDTFTAPSFEQEIADMEHAENLGALKGLTIEQMFTRPIDNPWAAWLSAPAMTPAQLAGVSSQEQFHLGAGGTIASAVPALGAEVGDATRTNFRCRRQGRRKRNAEPLKRKATHSWSEAKRAKRRIQAKYYGRRKQRTIAATATAARGGVRRSGPGRRVVHHVR